MASDLHVLVYGPVTAGICDYVRFGMFQEPLRELGVELRSLSDYTFRVSEDVRESLDEAFESESFVLDRSDIDWADVIVFRRFYETRWTCGDCSIPSTVDGREHAQRTGHRLVAPERLVRPLFGALEHYPEILRGRAVVYETDDDLLRIQAWNGVRNRVDHERDLVERMLRRADLVTVTTPVLAANIRRFNKSIRVVRNAVDPSWYVPGDEPLPDVDGDPRILYYGLPVRMRDYSVCREAVDEAARRHPTARRVWLGALDAPGASPSSIAEVQATVDETLPFVIGLRAFAQSLVRAQPHIGVAPVVGDDFDRAKSELHWLEYAMAGAATVASRTMEGGPYDVMRDGVDGLLARGKAEWRDALLRLAGSGTLREELVGNARERVLREYDVRVRAKEWADTYRWAAEHAGYGIQGRAHALGELPAAEIERQGVESLAHRGMIRELVAAAPERLAAIRGDREVCWTAADAIEPRVSVVIPVVDEPTALVERAIRSAIAQTHGRLEIVVAVARELRAAIDGPLETARFAALDPRVRVVPVDCGDGVPSERTRRDLHLRGAALAAGTRSAAGAWIAPLSPEGTFTPDHVETLLGVLIENALEFVYAQTAVAIPEADVLILGEWPPGPDTVLTLGTELYAAALTEAVPYDEQAWRDGETAGWSQWRRIVAAGARIARAEVVVHRLTPLESARENAA